jgi:signal peptidase II
MTRFLAIVAMVVGFDQLTKQWVVNTFSLYESWVCIPGFFNITYLTNKGAAFGFLASQSGAWRHYLFLVLGTVALVVIGVAWSRMRQAHPLYAIGLPMIAGGALGNLIDRIRFGSVVDFLDVHIQGHHWPAFNVADSAISMGVVVFFIANILEEKERRRSNVVGAIKEKKKGMQE